MRLQEFADSIADNEGRNFDYPFKERIKYSSKAIFSMLVRREIDQRGYLPDSLIKTIDCIPTVDESPTICKAPMACQVKRTKNKIPVPIRTKIASDFIYVGSTSGTLAYNYINPARLAYLTYSRFTAHIPYYTYLNGYIYIINAIPEMISVRFVPENLEDLSNLKDVDGKALFDVDTDSYFPADMVPIIKQFIYEELRIAKPEVEEEVKIDDTDKE